MDTSGVDPFCIARYVVGWEISLILMFIIFLHRGMGSFTKLATQELNKIWSTKMLSALTRVKPLSLASPIVILAEHGELTLVVVTNENPGWVPDGEGY